MTRCERTWQVESARDHRLAPDELAAFEQHRQQCEFCQQEQRELDALAQQLRAVGERVDDMAVRRLRQRTLEQAHELVHREPRRIKGLVPLALAAAALLVWIWHERTPEVAMVHVEAQQNARWHRAHEPDLERVELNDGTLLFRVARKEGDPRLLVRVPDGEIEDLGTVFSVTVADGKTREIVVREGRVMFHRNGASKLHLVAGTSWQAPPELTPVPDVEAAPPAPAAPEPAPQVKKAAPRRTPVVKESVVEVPDASAGEDAAYLHILSLLREGRRDEARLAAFSYLHTYPSGFRALEVSKVATMGNSDADRN